MNRLSAIIVLTTLLGAVPAAWAQNADVLSGFATNNDEPIKIEADRLTILDKDKKAEFSGNVKVVQGDMTMEAEKLIVFYSASAMDGMNGGGDKKKEEEKKAEGEAVAGKKSGGNAPQITKIVADGGVTVRQRDQVAQGEKAVYTAETQIVRLSGNVVLSQGKNVVRGDTLIVNLATRESKIESAGKSQDTGRVTFIGTPGSDEKGKKDKN